MTGPSAARTRTPRFSVRQGRPVELRRMLGAVVVGPDDNNGLCGCPFGCLFSYVAPTVRPFVVLVVVGPDDNNGLCGCPWGCLSSYVASTVGLGRSSCSLLSFWATTTGSVPDRDPSVVRRSDLRSGVCRVGDSGRRGKLSVGVPSVPVMQQMQHSFAGDPAALTLDQRLRALVEVEREIARLQARSARLVAAIVDDPCRDSPAPMVEKEYLGEEVRAVLGESAVSAHNRIALARTLV